MQEYTPVGAHTFLFEFLCRKNPSEVALSVRLYMVTNSSGKSLIFMRMYSGRVIGVMR